MNFLLPEPEQLLHYVTVLNTTAIEMCFADSRQGVRRAWELELGCSLS